MSSQVMLTLRIWGPHFEDPGVAAVCEGGRQKERKWRAVCWVSEGGRKWGACLNPPGRSRSHKKCVACPPLRAWISLTQGPVQG